MSSLDAGLIWLNSGVCSQNPAHSFWIDGQPLPLCARNLGLFGGFLLTFMLLRWWQPHWTLPYLLGLLPMLIDGTNSFSADAFGVFAYQPGNPLRLATGLVAGISLALVLARPRHSQAKGRRISPLSTTKVCIVTGLIALLSLADPYLAVAVMGTAGVLALITVNTRLARPMPAGLAWALALPELAAFAGAKQGLLLLVR